MVEAEALHPSVPSSDPTPLDHLIARLVASGDETSDESALLSQLFFDVMLSQYNLLSLKTFRIDLPRCNGLPCTPCLSHEVQLHAHDVPHVGGYVQDRETGALMGVVYVPLMRQIIVEEETVGTEREMESCQRFLQIRFPEHDVRVTRLKNNSAYNRARDVAEAHLPLLDVLTEIEHEPLRIQLAQLNGIATLMEKESRVTSWGMRTAYAPLAAAIAFVLVLVFPSQATGLSDFAWMDWMRLALLLLFGGGFLYYGLKAVQLTKTATRLNKRIREYEFVLDWKAQFRTTGGSDGSEASTSVLATEQGRALVSAIVEQAGGCEARSVHEAVRVRYETALRLLGMRSGEIDESTLLFCALRRDAIQSRQQALESELSELINAEPSARTVTIRTRLQRELTLLDSKTHQLNRLLA